MKNLACVFLAALPMLCSGMHIVAPKKTATDKKSTLKFSGYTRQIHETGFHNNNTNQIGSVSCTSPPGSISALAMPVHINLWLFEALSPSNNAEVEIIIHSFKFTRK